MRVPRPLRPLRGVVKRLMRWYLRMRVRHFGITRSQAEQWTQHVKKWPAIFGEDSYGRDVILDAGLVLNLRITDVVERSLLTDGGWDEPVGAYLRHRLREGDCFVDVGAHIGYFSLLASRRVGSGGSVIAFEPSIRMLERLSHNVRRNRCSNTTIVSVALGAESGWSTLSCSAADNPGGATLRPRNDGIWNERVPVMRFDDLVGDQAPLPSVVKIDVEGYELLVLRGMERTLKKASPAIVCEVSPRFLREQGQSGPELIRFMATLGYGAHLLNADGTPGVALPEAAPVLEGGDQLEVVFERE